MKESELSTGIVSFVDILGFGDIVATATEFSHVREIYNKLIIVQEAFEFRGTDDFTKSANEISNKTVNALSDSLIIYVPLESEATKYSGTFDPIMMELLGFAFSQGICVHNRIFVRGGLDLGWWYSNDGIIISDGLVNSVRMEAKANIPVLALCTELYEYFCNHDDRKTYHESIDPIKSMFRYYEDSNVGFYYLDYIYLCLNNMDWTPLGEERQLYYNSPQDERELMREIGHSKMIDNWLSAHARIIEDAARAVVQNKHLLYKYKWLETYHNETATIFTTNNECICNIG